MLKKGERLGRTEFLTFFKSGKRIHTDHLTLVFTPHPTFHGSVVVSKKVSKQAVTRNTIRRRMYAQLRTLRIVRTGVYIVMVKPSLVTLTKQAAQAEMSALIERMRKPA
jgi:ribonuclease P protein component